jgi:Ran GTPase-activating protein (RanGAP) involved in mRNA processing and transport
MHSFVHLNIQSCGLQDAEGIQLMRALIIGRKTPMLESVGLSRNQLGPKFGQQLISLLVEAIETAKQDAMELVAKNAAAGLLGNQDL